MRDRNSRRAIGNHLPVLVAVGLASLAWVNCSDDDEGVHGQRGELDVDPPTVEAPVGADFPITITTTSPESAYRGNGIDIYLTLPEHILWDDAAGVDGLDATMHADGYSYSDTAQDTGVLTFRCEAE